MTTPIEPGHVVTVFRSRLRPDAGDDYPAMAAELLERARAMPGFVDFKTFTASDGERVSIVTFDGLDHHRAWRDDPRHREGQTAGRERFYSEYAISVSVVEWAHAFTAGP